MQIYKLFRTPEWNTLADDKSTKGAPIDETDGYIHFSTAAQVPETASKHFADETELVLVACDAEAMGKDLKWEKSRGGQDFPHLYRKMTLEDVLWMVPVLYSDGRHHFPDTMI